MRAFVRAFFEAWKCPTCEHRNPKQRMQCRKCRRDRPLGA